MTIGVDAGCFGITDKQLQVGVYQVAKNLLSELGKQDTTNKYILYSFHPIDKDLLDLFGPRMHNIVVRPSKGWLKVWLPTRIAVDTIDLFLALSQALPYRLPFVRPYRSIAFVYDIAFEHYPALYPDSYAKLLRQTQDIAKHASHVITISQAAKEDFIAKNHVSPEKIDVVYPGSRDFFGHRSLGSTHSGPVKTKQTNYFLFVGALKRIKNVSTLIRAYDMFMKKIKQEYHLVIVGGSVWYDPEIDAALHAISPRTRNTIQFVGFVDDERLASLYANATAFVSPSFYEGFGLTFVEAMTAGCPVVGSTAGAIPEVVGDAGLLYDFSDKKGIAEAMYRLATDMRLRTGLRKKGIDRAKIFTWSKFATEVLRIINKVQ